ncbi:flagellar biosynthesis protein FlhF [Tissierella carlieri]|uniref:Flagellar biosynthesis protein FlhF n=1 Tax=Tissierella carlieri TaxID=689904 RepID=A0ABT1S5P1_9FIRM|nr:flagellar biosynthesis protein FlhF [Tissierella carlieri]MCQ4921775.1 flagellar biosynthesis protein FlhF [Tissierella carlieri]
MKIKKYVGQTAHEAMLKLKMELGPDAVVLNTKTIRPKGLFKYFKKPLVEITAAFEDKDLLNKNTISKYENKLNSINEELVELRNLVMNISVNKNEDEFFSPILKKFYNTIVNNGVDPEIAIELFKKMNSKINLEEKDNDTIERIVRFNLAEGLGSPGSIIVNEDQKVIFFIGPTGVGKTTTLAKIAANFVLKNKYDIGLITSDTYRIAAVEQLKIYSDILQLPLEIAYNKEEMIKAIDHFRNKDIILVDTAGRNHNDLGQVEELKEMLNTVKKKEVFLLVSATTDYKVLESVIDKYNFLDDYKLIITKIDEAENYGNILNIKHIANKELSYFTTGQNVPDDIQIIDVENIVKKLIEENNND